jgi:hypothetical protein
MPPPFHRAPNLAGLPGIAHGFFSREGGVSDGVYASLNCGPGSRDDPAKVKENRTRAVTALMSSSDTSGAKLVTLAQIHSAKVHIVNKDWDTSRHAEGDGMATTIPGMVLGIQAADCAPVLFADAKARVIGAAHAGWKGAVGGVLEATITAMESLGAKRVDIAAAIGPSIRQENYEVGGEFRDQLLAQDDANARFFIAREGRFRFDLPAYVGNRLSGAGISGLADLALSTYPPENGFFSFRRTTHRGEADYGRQISAIVLLK